MKVAFNIWPANGADSIYSIVADTAFSYKCCNDLDCGCGGDTAVEIEQVFLDGEEIYTDDFRKNYREDYEAAISVATTVADGDWCNEVIMPAHLPELRKEAKGWANRAFVTFQELRDFPGPDAPALSTDERLQSIELLASQIQEVGCASDRNVGESLVYLRHLIAHCDNARFVRAEYERITDIARRALAKRAFKVVEINAADNTAVFEIIQIKHHD